MLMILRKKGWDFAYKKTNNQVYDPETKKWEIYPKNKDEVKKDATTWTNWNDYCSSITLYWI